MINFRLIRHLWLFLAVAEEQHFGRAARRLDMSQPPLTEQIQALEQALKVQLFERSRRGAQLTPVGAAILPAVRKFADQLERLELAVREAVAGKSCNDPAKPAQVMRLRRTPQPGFSSSAPGGAVDGCRTESSQRSLGWRAAGSRSGDDGRIAP
jgi:molybdenum-dependent DNA-binding transcriptional regulator ModE